MRPAATPPHLGTIILLVGLSVASLNMFLPALPEMARDFGASEAAMGLAVSGYLIVAGALQLLLGPLSDRIGRRPVILGALAVYALASVGCLLADSLTVFLVCRLAQGTVIAGSIVTMAALRDMYPPREAAGKLGTVAAAMALAPMLGPPLGGVLDTVIGWRAIFVLYAVLGTGAVALVWADFGETQTGTARPLAAQVAAWRALLGSGAFWAYALCTGFSVGVFYVFLTGAPFVAVGVFGLSTAALGVGLGSISGGYMLGSAVTARLSPKVGMGPMILAGRLVAVGGLGLGALCFALGLSHPVLLFAATLSVGLGNGFTLANTHAGALSVRPDLAGSAAGLAGAMQLLGGAALTSVTLAWLGGGVSALRLLALMIAVALAALAFGVMAVRNGRRLGIDGGPA
jgi:Bcr/CflA subfamily drug resistance transporter